MAQYDVDLRDYWRILRKRKFTIIFMVIAVGATSYGAAKLKEPVPLYTATASVKIERSGSMLPRHSLYEASRLWYIQQK